MRQSVTIRAMNSGLQSIQSLQTQVREEAGDLRSGQDGQGDDGPQGLGYIFFMI